MGKITRHLWATATLFRTLGFLKVWPTLKDFGYELINCPKEKKVLVLSPHPDDEVFGAGGTILKMKMAEITALYLTGDKKREKEAGVAGKILGIKNQIFWSKKDGKLSFSPLLCRKLVKLITTINPESIFLPTFFDTHWDHLETNRLLVKASQQLKQSPQVYAYQIWQPGPFNRLVDISEVLGQKKKAINCFSSQLKDRDYLGAIIAYNSYLGKIYGVGETAECFLVTDLKNYAKLFRLTYE